MKSNEAADTKRSIAFLRAYIEIAGPLFFASGIPLEGGDVLHPDRSVNKRASNEGYLDLDERISGFSLMPKGEALLS